MHDRAGSRIHSVPEPSTLVGFSFAAILLFIIPGPAVLYIVARSVAQGRSAGLVSVAGVHAGSAVHIAAAVVGLSALLARSATAFALVKWAGAGYLIYLGVRTLRHGSDIGAGYSDSDSRSSRRLFADGLVINLLNPKTAVFFLAFVPQFVDQGAGSSTLQLLVLGSLFIVLGLVSDGAYVLAGASISRRMRTSETARRRVSNGAGVSYLGLGAWAALSGVGEPTT